MRTSLRNVTTKQITATGVVGTSGATTRIVAMHVPAGVTVVLTNGTDGTGTERTRVSVPGGQPTQEYDFGGHAIEFPGGCHATQTGAGTVTFLLA